MRTDIDITFDFRRDADGKDPDRHSKTLRRYHKQLWSKPLPGGELFGLEDGGPGGYLRYRSAKAKISHYPAMHEADQRSIRSDPGVHPPSLCRE